MSQFNLSSSSESPSIEEATQSSIEQVRHIASKEKITLSERITPSKFRAMELTHEGLEGHPNFLEELMRADHHIEEIFDTSALKPPSKSLSLLLERIKVKRYSIYYIR